MNILAIIPARGGSKGVPRKNVRLLAGKPLLAYTIEHARRTRGVHRVIVSTDDAEIAAISQQYGAEVIWRPAEISGDMASSESALLHTLSFLQQKESYVPDLLVFLQCTSPLTLAEDIEGTVQALLDQDADTALAVAPFHYFLWQTQADGDAIGINHDKRIRLLRQQGEPQYRETGAVYVMRTQGFLQAKHRFFGKTALYVMPPKRCHEIDDAVGFEIAEVLMRNHQQQKNLELLPDDPCALVLDFDGVITDNRVYVFQDGKEAVCCNRSDGWGISQLKSLGLPILVLSTEKNQVVKARADKMGIACLHGVTDKREALLAWSETHHLPLSRIVYLGNDVNDLSCLQIVGCPVIVNDAHPDVRAAARLVLTKRGGEGAVRELCDLLIKRMEVRGNP